MTRMAPSLTCARAKADGSASTSSRAVTACTGRRAGQSASSEMYTSLRPSGSRGRNWMYLPPKLFRPSRAPHRCRCLRRRRLLQPHSLSLSLRLRLHHRRCRHCRRCPKSKRCCQNPSQSVPPAFASRPELCGSFKLAWALRPRAALILLSPEECPCPAASAKMKRWPTWPRTLEHAPPGANVIGSKWVFKAKKDASGKVVRYKARLVAQGFSQVEGVDYFDTYTPVARLTSSRVVIAMANRLRLELHQVDIKGAYLNGELMADEVLYMRHPPSYHEDASGRVLQLRKSLYRLKQAGQRWYQKFTSILSTLGFQQCKVDQAVFFKHCKAPHVFIVIAMHVGGCAIAASSVAAIDALKARLCKHIEVMDLGKLHWMLGIKVRQDHAGGTVHLSQRLYIDSILRRYGFDDVKPISTH